MKFGNQNNINFSYKDIDIIGSKEVSSYSLLPYYPKNRYGENVDNLIATYRTIVYDFKDGDNGASVAHIIASAIRNKNIKLHNCCLVVIPASTQRKTENRFAEFADRLSKALGIANAYRAITTDDHEPLKGKMGVDKTEYFTFHPEYYRGKRVLLFDDVRTSGESFRQTAEVLMETGAKKIRGIFLAKTMR